MTNRYIDTIQKINQLQLRGFEKIKCGDAMCFTISQDEKNLNPLLSLLRIFRSTIISFTNRVIDSGRDDVVVFLYADTHEAREDYLRWFKDVYELCDKALVILPQKKIEFFGFSKMGYVLSWYSSFRRYFCRKDSLYYSSILATAQTEFEKIKKITDKYHRIYKFISLCDTHTISSLSTQYFNNMGIQTVTLEHGYYQEGIGDYAFKYSRSNFFLGYGLSMKECAVKAGMKPEKFILAGMPQLINRELPNEITISNNNVIGIVCSGGNLILDEDIPMIKIGCEVAKNMGWKVLVKFHPTVPASLYPDDLLHNVSAIYYSEISAQEFGELIDVCLVSSSTVFLEYLLDLRPTFLYPSKTGNYRDEKWCTVCNANELKISIDRLYDNPLKYKENARKAIRNYTVIDDVKNNYIDFINQY